MTDEQPLSEAQLRARRLREEADAKRSRAGQLSEQAEGMSQRASGMYGRFERGQPLLEGHNSFKGAVRDRNRADNATRRAIEAGREAGHADTKALRAEGRADMAERVAARTRPWTPADFRKGDVVTVRTFEAHEDTYRVKRVNPKSLTLDGGGGGWDDPRREYDRVLSRTRDGVTITDPAQADQSDT